MLDEFYPEVFGSRDFESVLDLTVEFPKLMNPHTYNRKEKDALEAYLKSVRHDLYSLYRKGVRVIEDPSFKFDIAPVAGLVSLPPPEVIISLYNNISLTIQSHKTALDILTDFATIIGATIPLIKYFLKILYLDKAHYKSEKIPSVTITIGDISITVTDSDLENTKHTATNIARKVLKEHPEALPSKKVNISSELIDPPPQAVLPVTSKSEIASSRSPHQQSRRKRRK